MWTHAKQTGKLYYTSAVTPAFQIALFLLQRPRPPDVLSVHVQL